MNLWLFLALVLFLVAGVVAVLQRAAVLALVSFGLACTLLPAVLKLVA